MAFDPSKLTVDYSNLSKIPTQARQQALQAGLLDNYIQNLSPTQLANLFPSYYKEEPEVPSGFARAASGGTGTGTGGGVSDTGGGTEGGSGDIYSGTGTATPSSRPSTSAGSKPASNESSSQRELTTEEKLDNLFSTYGVRPKTASQYSTSGIPAPGTFAATLHKGEMYKRDRGKMSMYTAFNQGRRLGYKYGNIGEGQSITLGEVMRRQALPETHKDRIFAYGAYQAIPKTLAGAVKALKLPPDAPFDGSPEGIANQTKVGTWLATTARPAINAYITGKSDNLSKAQEQMAMEWASMASVSKGGRSYYDDDGVNKAHVGLTETAAALNDMRKRYQENIAAGMSDFEAKQAAFTGFQQSTEQPQPEQPEIVVSDATKEFIQSLPESVQKSFNDDRLKMLEQGVQSGKFTYDDIRPKLQELETSSGATATPVKVVDAIEGSERIKPVPASQEELISWWSERSPRTDIEKIKKVDPVLLKSYAEAIQQYEANNPGKRVEAFGPSAGVRYSGSTSNHGIGPNGFGRALDLVIIDEKTGKQLNNLGVSGYANQVGSSGEAAAEYTELHGFARVAQEHFFPNSPNLRQGGGFATGSTAGDWMHGDITGRGMGGYSWEKGYTSSQMRKFGISAEQNFRLGDEKFIRELGNQIYGQVDEQGYYVNRGQTVNDPVTGGKTISYAQYQKAEETAKPQTEQPDSMQAPQTESIPVPQAQQSTQPQQQNRFAVNEEAVIKAWREQNPIKSAFAGDDDVREGIIKELPKYGIKKDLNTGQYVVTDPQLFEAGKTRLQEEYKLKTEDFMTPVSTNNMGDTVSPTQQGLSESPPVAPVPGQDNTSTISNNMESVARSTPVQTAEEPAPAPTSNVAKPMALGTGDNPIEVGTAKTGEAKLITKDGSSYQIGENQPEEVHIKSKYNPDEIASKNDIDMTSENPKVNNNNSQQRPQQNQSGEPSYAEMDFLPGATGQEFNWSSSQMKHIKNSMFGGFSKHRDDYGSKNQSGYG
jgi:hypothetical protein